MDESKESALDRPYGGKASQERADERRERLLDAAVELFGTQGYAATTLQQICAQAKVAPRHFYECFPGREALLIQILEDCAQEGMARVRACSKDLSSGIDSYLRSRLSAIIDFYGSDPRLTRILCIEVVGVSDAVEVQRRSKSREFVQLILDDLQRLVESQLVPRRNYRMTAIAMVGAIDELLTEWVLQPQSISIDLIIQEATRLFVAVVS